MCHVVHEPKQKPMWQINENKVTNIKAFLFLDTFTNFKFGMSETI